MHIRKEKMNPLGEKNNLKLGTVFSIVCSGIEIRHDFVYKFERVI